MVCVPGTFSYWNDTTDVAAAWWPGQTAVPVSQRTPTDPTLCSACQASTWAAMSGATACQPCKVRWALCCNCTPHACRPGSPAPCLGTACWPCQQAPYPLPCRFVTLAPPCACSMCCDALCLQAGYYPAVTVAPSPITWTYISASNRDYAEVLQTTPAACPALYWKAETDSRWGRPGPPCLCGGSVRGGPAAHPGSPATLRHTCLALPCPAVPPSHLACSLTCSACGPGMSTNTPSAAFACTDCAPGFVNPCQIENAFDSDEVDAPYYDPQPNLVEYYNVVANASL